MGAPKNNRNAYKYGIYARHIPADLHPQFARMPADDTQNEIAFIRFLVLRAYELSSPRDSFEKKYDSIDLTFKGLEYLSRMVARRRRQQGSTPALQDLWSAVAQANRLDGVDRDV